jgi:ABC-type nickel/cobalt efflux system permease component RcnA
MDDDWNVKQIVGFVLMIFSGLVGLVALIVLLCKFLRGEIVGGILLVLMMITGIYLWKKGSKENNKKD